MLEVWEVGSIAARQESVRAQHYYLSVVGVRVGLRVKITVLGDGLVNVKAK